MDKRLMRRLKDIRMVLAVSMMLGLLSTLCLIGQARALTVIVNGSFQFHQSLDMLSNTLWALLAIILVRGVLAWSSRVVAVRLSLRLKANLRADLTKHLIALGPAFMKDERAGELVNTVFDGVEQLDGYVSGYVPQLALAAIAPLVIGCFVLFQDGVSAVILGLTAPLIPIFMVLIGKSAQAMTDKQWRLMGVLGSHFLGVLKGLPTLRLFQRCDAQVEIIRRMTDEYRLATMKPLRVAFLSSFVLELLTTLGTAMVAVGLGLRLLSGHLTFESSFIVLLLVPEFYLPIRVLGTQYHASMNGITAAHRILDLLDEPCRSITRHGLLPTWPATGHIEFRAVSFTYPGSTEPAVDNLSFIIRPGETVAFVGPTGAGKTTVIDLLLGFLQPTKGTILLDGIPAEQLPGTWIRQQFAHVAQSPYMFAGSIRDNLCLADPSCPEHEMEDAVKVAAAESFIRELPDRYDTWIGEGGQGLSGGQLQRIAIARALVKDSPVLLFDEPTAHLDVETESAIHGMLNVTLRHKTVLLIAHRFSTIRRAERVFVMERGRIVEAGSHTELLRQNGLYSRMFQSTERSVV